MENINQISEQIITKIDDLNNAADDDRKKSILYEIDVNKRHYMKIIYQSLLQKVNTYQELLRRHGVEPVGEDMRDVMKSVSEMIDEASLFYFVLAVFDEARTSLVTDSNVCLSRNNRKFMLKCLGLSVWQTCNYAGCDFSVNAIVHKQADNTANLAGVAVGIYLQQMPAMFLKKNLSAYDDSDLKKTWIENLSRDDVWYAREAIHSLDGNYSAAREYMQCVAASCSAAFAMFDYNLRRDAVLLQKFLKSLYQVLLDDLDERNVGQVELQDYAEMDDVSLLFMKEVLHMATSAKYDGWVDNCNGNYHNVCLMMFMCATTSIYLLNIACRTPATVKGRGEKNYMNPFKQDAADKNEACKMLRKRIVCATMPLLKMCLMLSSLKNENQLAKHNLFRENSKDGIKDFMVILFRLFVECFNSCQAPENEDQLNVNDNLHGLMLKCQAQEYVVPQNLQEVENSIRNINFEDGFENRTAWHVKVKEVVEKMIRSFVPPDIEFFQKVNGRGGIKDEKRFAMQGEFSEQAIGLKKISARLL